jgi:hypothetical protein
MGATLIFLMIGCLGGIPGGSGGMLLILRRKAVLE